MTTNNKNTTNTKNNNKGNHDASIPLLINSNMNSWYENNNRTVPQPQTTTTTHPFAEQETSDPVDGGDPHGTLVGHLVHGRSKTSRQKS